MPPKTASKKKSTASKKPNRTGTSRRSAATAVQSVRRVASAYREDDVVGSASAGRFGRCGGRLMTSHIEQTLCDQLSRHGVTHSHSPRHFEVRLEDDSVAAYAPMIVLRGRGREGKTVVIEGSETPEKVTLDKITAFRKQYGVEFYLCFIAPEEVLDAVSIRTYDEASTTRDAHTLISRLAD